MKQSTLYGITFGVLTVVLMGIGLLSYLNRSAERGPSSPIVQNPVNSSSTTATSTPTSTPPIVTPTSTPNPDPTPTPTSTTPKPVQPEIVYADRSKNQVVFTFDGGAGNHSNTEILAVLAKHNVKGTYFLTGKYGELFPNDVRAIHAAGHEIFNHTYSHPDLTTLSATAIAEEFSRTETILKSLTNKTTQPFFRPPFGARNAQVLQAAANAGYRSVYWTTDALDWKPGITDEEVKKRILDNVKPGTIYLMHIGDDITGRILDEVFTEIKARGYTLASLTEAL